MHARDIVASETERLLHCNGIEQITNICQPIRSMHCGHSLFCALRPPPDQARYLREQLDWLGVDEDRVEPARYHVTLVALGRWPSHPANLIERARDVCASLEARSFRVVFDHLVISNRILLKPSEGIPALERFQRRLGDALADKGLAPRRSGSFHPHLTASYRSNAGGRAFVPPVSWVVREFVLIESLIGRRSQIDRGRWQLTEHA
jgi:2'-5' RNA ligase